jgi:flagellar hook-associated protein 2
MANTQIDGLVSGLDTSTIISQLLQIEAQGQTRLKTKVSSEQSVISAYQAVNSALKTAVDSSKKLDTATDWKVFSATSSATSVAATAGSGASPGTYTFDVTGLAAAHSVLYGTAAAKTDVVAGSSIDVTVGSTTTPLNVGGGTLDEVVSAINGSSLGVRAGTIKVADGSYRLQLSATATGAAGQFSIGGLTSALGAATVTKTGADATIQIGPDPVNDVVKSSSNTFSEVFSGVSFTVSKQETGVAVTVGTNNTALSGSVKSLVDALNSTLNEIGKDTAYNATTKTGGVLLGQQLPSRVANDLRNAVLTPSGDTLASIGIELTSTGTVKLDQTKLSDALAADAGKVQSLVSAFAQRVVAVAEPVSRSGGEITSVVDGRQALIRDLNQQIDEWDVRLALRQSTLQRQYASLETALGSMKQQSSWLAGQINSLS